MQLYGVSDSIALTFYNVQLGIVRKSIKPKLGIFYGDIGPE
jgi:hypothetical protein